MNIATAALPEGKKEIIVAPTNAAFENLLTKLGLTADELVSSELFVPTLATHIAVATNNGASQADTVAGSKIRLYQGTEGTTKLPLTDIATGTTFGSSTVQGPMNKATAFQTINCNDGTYVFAVDTVLEPKEISGVIPTSAPAPDATTVPEVVDPVTAVPPVVEETPVMSMSPMPEIMPVVVAIPSPEPVVVPSPSPEPVPSPSPEPVPVPATPAAATPVVSSSATGLKAAIGSAMAVIAATFL